MIKLVSFEEVTKYTLDLHFGGNGNYKFDGLITISEKMKEIVKPNDAIRSKRNGYNRFEVMLFVLVTELYFADIEHFLMSNLIGNVRVKAYKFFKDPNNIPKDLWIFRTGLTTEFLTFKEVTNRLKSWDNNRVSLIFNLIDTWEDTGHLFGMKRRTFF